MRSGEPTQPQPVELQDPFEVSEEHLYFLAFSHGADELGRRGKRASDVARALVDAAGDLADRRVRAAALLRRAMRAVLGAGAVDDRVGLGDVIARVLERAPIAPKGMPLGAAVLVGVLVPFELGS